MIMETGGSSDESFCEAEFSSIRFLHLRNFLSFAIWFYLHKNIYIFMANFTLNYSPLSTIRRVLSCLLNNLFHLLKTRGQRVSEWGRERWRNYVKQMNLCESFKEMSACHSLTQPANQRSWHETKGKFSISTCSSPFLFHFAFSPSSSSFSQL